MFQAVLGNFMESKLLARQIRIDSLNMTSNGGSSHIGSCLSIADILAVLYSKIIRFNPHNTKDEYRDIFILSKGHAGAALYSTLANLGFFDTSLLKLHYKNGSIFSGHVSHAAVPGVEFSTGSLGHGLSVGAGYALGFKKRRMDRNVYVLMSDGECNEGSNWEPIMFAAHHKLNNLIAIIDKNNLQSIKTTNETLNLGDLGKKFTEFGWNVVTVDGHNHSEIYSALLSQNNHAPKVIIATTIKGKGVSFMENNPLWHYRTAINNEYEMALDELKGAV
jgi:transketolase